MTSAEQAEVRQIVLDVLGEVGASVENTTEVPTVNTITDDDTTLPFVNRSQGLATGYRQISVSNLAQTVAERIDPADVLLNNLDDEPTEDSEHLVTSGGVFGAIADVDAKVSAAIAGVKVSLTVSPSVIYKGESQSITLTGTMSNGTPTSMKLFDGTTDLQGTEDLANSRVTKTISGLTLADNSKAYRVEGVTLGMTLTATASVAARYPIYYGFGATASAVKVGANKYAATTSAFHTYEKTLAAGSANKYFYLLVPTDIAAPAVGDFTMNKGPFVVEKNPSGDTVTGYNVYRSASDYAAGTTIRAEVGD